MHIAEAGDATTADVPTATPSTGQFEVTGSSIIDLSHTTADEVMDEHISPQLNSSDEIDEIEGSMRAEHDEKRLWLTSFYERTEAELRAALAVTPDTESTTYLILHHTILHYS